MRGKPAAAVPLNDLANYGLSFRNAIAQQGALLGPQQEELAASNQAVRDMAGQMAALTTLVQQLRLSPNTGSATTNAEAAAAPHPAVSTISRHSEPHLNHPPPYSGEPNTCRSFLSQCALAFSLQPSAFPSESSKVAYIITLLTVRAQEWGTAVWDNNNSCCSSFQSFSAEFRKVFDREARILSDICQGERSVSDFSIEFRTITATCGLNEKAQWDRFLHGLSDRVQDKIYTLDLPAGFDDLVDLAIRVDDRLTLRRHCHRTYTCHE
ncbi:uncharacterized protein fas isoform X2 [Myxocyprinus asiaticus]|uniref:uncharacterized protein fas isoform X2 n=1 Tax=Myxocyprinus asiaticus TaxID=70543 RepID=UPI0022233792|nr:uncharacterized protein fas isoform X2 [Myxocyprinus asiaticus]